MRWSASGVKLRAPHPGPPPVPLVPDVSEGVRHRLQQNIAQGAGVNGSRVALGPLQQVKERKEKF